MTNPMTTKTILNTFVVRLTNGPVRRARLSVRATSYAEAGLAARDMVAKWEADRPYDQLAQGVNWRWTISSIEVQLDEPFEAIYNES